MELFNVFFTLPENRFVLYASMLDSVCAVSVRICLRILCFVVIKLAEIGNISSILKEGSLGCTLDKVRLEEQWHLNGSQTIWPSEVLYKGEEHSEMNIPGRGRRGSLRLEVSDSDFPYLSTGEGWQLTPVFLPGEFHGQRSLAGYGP